MGLFKKIFSDVADELKKSLEETKKEMRNNLEEMKQNAMAGFTDSTSNSRDDDEEDDEEPKILLGDFSDGVLTIREGITELDGESLEHYKRIRKIVFPASLENLDSYVIDEQHQLEELDFSKVTKLKTIPDDFISGENKISKFVIPNGVTEVGSGFLGDAKSGAEIFVPASVSKLGFISENSNNDMIVYLFAADIDISDVESCAKTLYVLPNYYAQYAKKLKDCYSEASLREMPADKQNFYANPADEEPTPAAQPAPSSVLSDVPPIPVSNPKTEGKKQLGVFSARLESIIEAALQDGVLTQKEREVILRRAEKEGEDLDEFELLFDARLAQLGIKVEEIEKPSAVQAPEMPQNDSSRGPDGMFSERLEFLIHNAIEAGSITEKAREIIIKRAQAEGEDLDEVDIYIQSLLQKKEMGEL